MEAVFLKLLNMSLTACVLILAVLPVRALLKKAPRWSICLLWGLVAMRLICPVTIESSLSLIPKSEPVSQEIFEVEAPARPEVTVSEQTLVQEARPLPEAWMSVAEQEVPAADTPSLLVICSYLWLAGAFGMVLYAFLSFCLLKRRVATATFLEGNIRQSEFVDSPFVLGVFRPQIYLPYGLTKPHLDHILAHERSHIRRGDHLIKPLGFLILSVHWFNPLVWVAYILLCRDIEAACDEKVIKEMSHEQRQSYSATLLRCSVQRRRIAACPVAFGETGVKQRIKGVLNYKKPTLWIILAALVFGIVAGACFLTDRPEEPQLTEPTEPPLTPQDHMDELLDELLDHDDPSVASSPKKCAMLNREAYEELLAYDELALSYFIPKLRKADVHSFREYMMAFVCSDLTGVGFDDYYGTSAWYKTPQQWIAIYDRSVSTPNSDQRLRPGIYSPMTTWVGNNFLTYGDVWGEANRVSYYVTADKLVSVYDRMGQVVDVYHSFNDTLQEKVQWQWESPNGVGAPKTQWAADLDAVLDKSLTRLDDSMLDLPDFSGDRLYQPLEDSRCLMLCNGKVYFIQSEYGVSPFSYLRYVSELVCVEYT